MAEVINEKSLAMFAEKSKKIFAEVRKDVIGQNEVVEFTILAIIAGGNVLLEGAPGLGKTRLVRSLGRVFDLPFFPYSVHPRPDACGRNGYQHYRQGQGRKLLLLLPARSYFQ